MQLKSINPSNNQVLGEVEITNGELSVFLDGVEHKLQERDKLEIKPGTHHYAIGNETWVRCTSRLG